MNKRCIVNVATGDFYCKMQERLTQSFFNSVDNIYECFHNGIWPAEGSYKAEKGIDLIYWNDSLPTGSRPHSESPYGFKVHAIKAAYEKGYTSVLWLDSPAYAVKEDISPIFEKIEKEGYYAMSHIDPLMFHVGGISLEKYHKCRDHLAGFNLPSGSCYGFDLKSKTGKYVFTELDTMEYIGLFKDDALWDNNKIVWRHRHDESCLALALLDRNLPVFTFDPLFQSPSPECVIRSGEFVDITPNI